MSKQSIFGSKNWIMVPTQPLRDLMNNRYPKETARQKGQRLGVSRETYQRINDNEVMTYIRADRYAVSLGLHPACIWSDWYELTTK